MVSILSKSGSYFSQTKALLLVIKRLVFPNSTSIHVHIHFTQLLLISKTMPLPHHSPLPKQSFCQYDKLYYIIMISRNTLISLITITLILISLFFLSHMAFNNYQYLMPSSQPRLTGFVAIHLIMICMMVWFSTLQNTYDYVKWGFSFSFALAFLMTSIQVIISAKKLNNKGFEIKTVQPLELAYLNCYFIIYMYSLISTFLSGTFICLTKCCIKFQQYRIQQAIRSSIFPIEFSSSLSTMQCAICLCEIEDGEQLLQIKCKHVFHRECLISWVKQKQTCPTCRFNAFQGIAQGQEASVLDGML